MMTMMKSLWAGAALALVLSGCASSGTGHVLGPGVYPVLSAEYEVEDDDYELELKDHGEYDVLFDDLYIVMDAGRKEMTLEISTDRKQTLYLRGPRDLKRDREKKKKDAKKASTPVKPATSSGSTTAPAPAPAPTK
jgi:hypothetical protein